MLLVRRTNLFSHCLVLHHLKQTLVTLQQQPCLRQPQQRHQVVAAVAVAVAAVVAAVVAAAVAVAVATMSQHQLQLCQQGQHQLLLCRQIRRHQQRCRQAVHEIRTAVL